MAWHMTGQLIEAGSCKATCPCVLGPAEPDQGWCSGALTFVIQEGASDGVALGSRKVLLLIDLPKDFASGNGTVRIYIDDAADARQRQELEAIFTGKKGGPGEVLGSLVTKWLSTQTATITIDGGDNPSITVGAVGHMKLNRIKDERGRATKLLNAPVLADGYFKTPHTLGELVQHVETNMASKFKQSDFSGSLARYVRNGKLKRTKNSDGQYEYVAG